MSEYTRDLIVAEAAQVDARHGTDFARRCRERIGISYPAIDTAAYLDLDPAKSRRTWPAAAWNAGGYVLFLSRLARAKGVDDLIAGFDRSRTRDHAWLVIAGRGPEAAELREAAAASGGGRAHHASSTTSPTRRSPTSWPAAPRTCCRASRGRSSSRRSASRWWRRCSPGAGRSSPPTPAASGRPSGTAPSIVPVEDPDALAAALDRAVLDLSPAERADWERRARAHALQFDRAAVFDRMFARLPQAVAEVG